MARKKSALLQRRNIPVGHIHPNPRVAGQPAEEAVAQMIQELTESGREAPVLVREDKKGRRYTVIRGKERLEAARRLKLPLLDAIVAPAACDAQLALVEKLDEESLSPWLLSDALLALKTQLGWTQHHLALALGKSRDWVAMMLGFQQVLPAARKTLEAAAQTAPVSLRHLRHVARLKQEDQLAQVYQILKDRPATRKLEGEKKKKRLAEKPGELIKVRRLKKVDSAQAPRSLKEWRKYQRQLATDLKRIDQQENSLAQRAADLMAEARRLQKALGQEVSRKRRELNAELKLVRKFLAQMDK